MKILVTGGAGFQGSHLVEYLLINGHSVSVLNTYSEVAVRNLSPFAKMINVIWGSVTDRETVEKSVRDHDVVFHLAAHINVDESLKDPWIFYETNVKGTYYFLESIIKNNSRLIFASSCEVYGGVVSGSTDTIKESSEMAPKSPYAGSKASADRLCYVYSQCFGANVTIVRPFNVYGERQKDGQFGAVIPIFVSKAQKGEDLIVLGSGEQTRDYSHVSDIVQAYDLILNNDNLRGKAINFASGENTKIIDLANYIAKRFNVKVIHKLSRPGEVMQFPADISLARSLGWQPKIGIWEGIDKYINWKLKSNL